MNKITHILIYAAIFIGFASSYASADVKRGIDAYKTGDFETAEWEFLDSAKQGIVEGQVNVAILYENGQGVTQDHLKAAYWYEKAASQGDKTSMFVLGEFYTKGLGIDKDLSHAIIWYNRAANLGELSAQYALGHIYEMGIGTQIDLAKSLKFYQMAADQKYKPAIQKVDFLKKQSVGG